MKIPKTTLFFASFATLVLFHLINHFTFSPALYWGCYFTLVLFAFRELRRIPKF